MSRPHLSLNPANPLVVGSFGNLRSLSSATPELVRGSCDLLEIRLDLLDEESSLAAQDRPWSHLAASPLLFTARIGTEGGAGDLSPARRTALLEAVAAEAALIDIELASLLEMSDLIGSLKNKGIPWIASWHDFEGRPGTFGKIPAMAEEAARAGAACFKAAVRLHDAADLASLAQLLGSAGPIPLALMGMGPLAPVSRLLCAQYGSVLNYGYIGDAPTAPGQWSAARLKEAIAALEVLR